MNGHLSWATSVDQSRLFLVPFLELRDKPEETPATLKYSSNKPKIRSASISPEKAPGNGCYSLVTTCVQPYDGAPNIFR